MIDLNPVANAARYVADGHDADVAAAKFGVPVEEVRAWIAAANSAAGLLGDWSDDVAPAAEPSTLDLIRNALLDTYGLDHIRPPKAVVDGILYADSIAWLIGSPGHGKSF